LVDEVTDNQVKAHKAKGTLLVIQKPKVDGRGKKRKFSDADMKLVKQKLKKRKATPSKVARKLSISPNFGRTISEKTIRNRLKLTRNRN